MNKHSSYRTFITFWPEYVEELNWQFQNKVQLIQAPVDLDKYNPEGKKFDWGEHKGSFNILVADIWRDDVKPYNTIIACAKYIKEYNPTAKLHIIGLEKLKHGALHRFVRILREQNVLGYIAGVMRNPEDYFRAADVVVTNHVIDTRVVREAMACGCPVVKSTFNFLDTDGFAEYIDLGFHNLDKREIVRKNAEHRFSCAESGRQMKEVCEDILKKGNFPIQEIRQKQERVFLDIGSHTGETVENFYKDVIWASKWKIHCFEPITSAKLRENTKQHKNIEYHDYCVSDGDGEQTIFGGLTNFNEGATVCLGKLTGGISYDGGHSIRSINLDGWLESNIKNTCVIKVNIEGAEYRILPILIKYLKSGKIEKLYIQLHSHKFEEPCKSYYIALDNWFEYQIRINELQNKVTIMRKGYFSFESLND